MHLSYMKKFKNHDYKIIIKSFINIQIFKYFNFSMKSKPYILISSNYKMIF